MSTQHTNERRHSLILIPCLQRSYEHYLVMVPYSILFCFCVCVCVFKFSLSSPPLLLLIIHLHRLLIYLFIFLILWWPPHFDLYACLLLITSLRGGMHFGRVFHVFSIHFSISINSSPLSPFSPKLQQWRVFLDLPWRPTECLGQKQNFGSFASFSFYVENNPFYHYSLLRSAIFIMRSFHFLLCYCFNLIVVLFYLSLF